MSLMDRVYTSQQHADGITGQNSEVFTGAYRETEKTLRRKHARRLHAQ